MGIVRSICIILFSPTHFTLEKNWFYLFNKNLDYFLSNLDINIFLFQDGIGHQNYSMEQENMMKGLISGMWYGYYNYIWHVRGVYINITFLNVQIIIVIYNYHNWHFRAVGCILGELLNNSPLFPVSYTVFYNIVFFAENYYGATEQLCKLPLMEAPLITSYTGSPILNTEFKIHL